LESLSFVAKSKGVFYLERRHLDGIERKSANKTFTPQTEFAVRMTAFREILC